MEAAPDRGTSLVWRHASGVNQGLLCQGWLTAFDTAKQHFWLSENYKRHSLKNRNPHWRRSHWQPLQTILLHHLSIPQQQKQQQKTGLWKSSKLLRLTSENVCNSTYSESVCVKIMPPQGAGASASPALCLLLWQPPRWMLSAFWSWLCCFPRQPCATRLMSTFNWEMLR